MTHATPLTRAALERAMTNDELVLHYQPKVCLLRGEVIGAEALVRWNDGGRDIIPPDEFLPLAESSGLLHDITIKLLDQVVAACTSLRDTQAGLALSMNVAADDLASNTISSRIGRLLEAGTISSQELQIEITESAAMSKFDRVHDDLLRLTGLGIKVLMDDFGTGYSSIDRLSQLPFSSLKLDQGVVRRMGTSRQNLDVVRSAISMARELRMTSVAEGIESAGAYNFLIANGCEEAQGFWIARPMSLDDFHDFVRAPHDFTGSQIGRVHQAILNLLQFRKSLVDAVFCNRLGTSDTLPSVMDPGFSSDVASSRVGVWYYGIGQQLTGNASFRALEAPLVDVHETGHRLMASLTSGAEGPSVDLAMAEIDKRVDRVIVLMHALERELLAERLV